MTEPETNAEESGPVAAAVEPATSEETVPTVTPAKRGAPEYEFSERQNELVGALAAKMMFVGTMMIVFGALLDIVGLVSIVVFHLAPTSGGALTNVIAGAALFCVGFWTRGAAARFQRIVDTEGSDVSNLMSALEELFRIYSLQRVLFLFTSALVVIGVLVHFLTAP